LVLNLVRNGLESMTEQGLVIVRTRATVGEVLLSVIDTGSGMPPT
jgi:signal transduction histidine kinase